MDNKHYQIYINSILALAQSIVLKSEYTAQRINDKLFIQHGEGTYDASDRTTWKYYLNLAGQYHSTDTIMTVRSFDTLEEIEFTSYNLEFHLATKNEYAIGGDRFNELVERYPEQEALIVGILNPVDINAAIEAKEFTILSYREDLVESNEYSLIYELQQTIDGMVGRYFNPQFNRTDDLYYASFIACLYMTLIPAIGVHRKRMSKTSEAHSYHQFMYLSSYSGIGANISQMTLSQRMYFMRNVEYLMHHAGTKQTFSAVKKVLIDDVGLPIGAMHIEHDTSDMPAEVRPKLNFKKVPLNNNISGEVTSVYQTSTVLDSVNTLASGNRTTRESYEEVFERKAANSLSSSINTKILDSSFVEDQGSDTVSLEELVINHWMILSHYDYIKTVHEFTSPVSRVRFTLNAKDAYIFYLYCYSRYTGTIIRSVPITRANRVQRIPAVSYEEVVNLIGVDHDLPLSFVQEIVQQMPYPAEFYSTESFKSYYSTLHEVANEQLERVSLVEGFMERGEAAIAVNALWMTSDINLNDQYTLTDTGIVLEPGSRNIAFEEWFRIKGISIDRMVDDDFDSMWSEIMLAVTGLQVSESQSKKNIQAAMTRTLGNFSSYSTRVTINNRTSRSIHAGPIGQRYRIGRVRLGGDIRIVTNHVRVRRISSGYVTKVYDDLNKGGVVARAWAVMHDVCKGQYDPVVSIQSHKTVFKDYARYPLNMAGALRTTGYIDDEPVSL